MDEDPLFLKEIDDLLTPNTAPNRDAGDQAARNRSPRPADTDADTDEPERRGFAQDGNAPDPLDDPLRVMRKFYGWLSAIQLLFACGAVLIVLFVKPGAGVSNALFPMVFGCIVSLPVFFAFWRVLPNRSVDVIYLRSFSKDRHTGAIRTALQSAFGRHFRLSGIRDPRRRWPKFIRYLAVFAFALRYSTPKYMNLEAGHDWKRRLWSSLGDARCAVIDLTDLTSYVAEEIRLCYKCLGLHRILFVGDTSKTATEWEEVIAAALRAGALSSASG